MDTLRLPVEHGAPAAPLREQVQVLLGEHLTADDVDDALLVVSELVQNVTQHTSGDGELVVTVTLENVMIEVSDHASDAPFVQLPDARRIGGRGLLLVAAIARRWGWHPHTNGKIVWAQIALPARTPAYTTV